MKRYPNTVKPCPWYLFIDGVPFEQCTLPKKHDQRHRINHVADLIPKMNAATLLEWGKR